MSSATSCNHISIQDARNAGSLPEGDPALPVCHPVESPMEETSTPQNQQALNSSRSFEFPWLTHLGFVFLSFNTAMAIYQCRGDVAAIASHVSTYLNIAGIFICLKLFRRAPANSKWRDTLRAGIWVLTVSLTFGYVYQVTGTATKPTLQVAMLQWAMPATIGTAAFILFFQKDM